MPIVLFLHHKGSLLLCYPSVIDDVLNQNFHILKTIHTTSIATARQRQKHIRKPLAH